MHLAKIVLLLLSTLFFICAKKTPVVSLDPEFFKSVQGPPEEFALHYLPQPKASALVSETDTFPVVLRLQHNAPHKTWTWKGNVAIDSDDEAVISLVTPIKNFKIQIAEPAKDQDPETLKEADFAEVKHFFPQAQRVDSWFGLEKEQSIPMVSFIIEKPKTGIYTLKISTQEEPTQFIPKFQKNKNNNNEPSVVVIIYNKTPIQMFSHLSNDYDHLLVDRQVFMQTRLFKHLLYNNNNSTAQKLTDPDPIVSVISADIDLISPNGNEQIITMHDDGKNNDGSKGDGIYGASFVATEEGTYIARITMQGVNPANHQVFSRSSDHVFTVIENDNLQFENEASVNMDTNEEMIEFALHLTYDANRTAEVVGQKYRAYAEVWATSSDRSEKQFVPVAFITGMSIAEQGSFVHKKQNQLAMVLKLKLSQQWLSKAKAVAPFQLRNLYVQEASTNIPVADAKAVDIPLDNVQISVSNENDQMIAQVMEKAQNNRNQLVQAIMTSLTETRFKFSGQISETMTYGKRPQKYMQKLNKSANNGTNEQGKIILVHGYCASLCPWTESDFTNAEVFLDLKQSRSHDDFALLIRQFADNYPAFSIAAHSQGGCASTHLKAFYWSNQDGTVSDEEHRQITTVGTPYKGNAFAGSLANIGKIFGVGCGVNQDLTRDGSALWLASVPKSARQAVYFYTTQYKEKSYCQFGSNLILSKPNDGVAETEWAMLDDANYMGHTNDQCHSDGMKYTAQCRDPARNAEINKKAARGL